MKMLGMFFFVMLCFASALFAQNPAGGVTSYGRDTSIGSGALKTDSAEFGRLFRVPDFGRPAIVPLADGVQGGDSVVNSASPSWLKDIRRAEIVALGSLPLTVFWTSFVIDMFRYSNHGWDRAYAPWPLKSAGAVAMDYNELRTLFGVAVGSSVAIALIDHVIVRVKRAKTQKAETDSAQIIKRESYSFPGD